MRRCETWSTSGQLTVDLIALPPETAQDGFIWVLSGAGVPWPLRAECSTES